MNEPIGTEVHIACAGNSITTFGIGRCNCEGKSHHMLTIQLSRSHVAKIFLTAAQVDRLSVLLDEYCPEMHAAAGVTDESIAADLAAPLPEAPDDRPTADDLQAALGKTGVGE